MPTKPGTYATFKTTQGTIVCELFEQHAPQTVANFIGLAEGTKEWNSRSKKGAKISRSSDLPSRPPKAPSSASSSSSTHPRPSPTSSASPKAPRSGTPAPRRAPSSPALPIYLQDHPRHHRLRALRAARTPDRRQLHRPRRRHQGVELPLQEGRQALRRH